MHKYSDPESASDSTSRGFKSGLFGLSSFNVACAIPINGSLAESFHGSRQQFQQFSSSDEIRTQIG